MDGKKQQISGKTEECLAQAEDRLIDMLTALEDELELFDYLVLAGAKALPLPKELRTDEHLVAGCQAKLWVSADVSDGRARIAVACDSILIKGVAAVLAELLSGRTCGEIMDYRMRFVDQTDIRYLLSTDRRHGMDKVLEKIRSDLAIAILSPESRLLPA